MDNKYEILVSNKDITSVADELPLTYRIEDDADAQGKPALGWLADSEQMANNTWLLSFELVDDSVSKFLPDANSDSFEYGVKDGVLKSVIAILPNGVALPQVLNSITDSKKGIKVEGKELDRKARRYSREHRVSYEEALLNIQEEV